MQLQLGPDVAQSIQIYVLDMCHIHTYTYVSRFKVLP